MRKTARILCLLLVVAMLLSGCTKKEPDPATPTTPVAPAAKDTLKVAFTSEPPNLSTLDHDSLISVGMNLLTFNSLYKIDHATLLPVPDLATEYTVDEAGTTWTFKLRDGVKFHNGDPFTADDVKATIEKAQSVAGSKLYTGSIVEVKVVDPLTVQLVTAEPYAGLLFDLGYHYNFIMPKKLIEAGHDFNKEPIGTGPYKLVNWTAGTSLKYEANEEYFDADHKAKIKNLEFVVIPEGATRTMALESGEVDFVWDVPGADAAKVEGNTALYLHKVNTVDNVQLFLNNDVKPFDDPKVRLAVSYAIDRQAIVDGALNGFGTPNYSLISQGFWGSTTTNAVEYNKLMASNLLADWKGDVTKIKLPILCSNETRANIATIIQDNLREVGIAVDVIQLDTATYFQKWNAGEYTGALASWSPSNSLTYVQRYHSERRASQPGALNSKEIDALVLKAKGTIKDDDRLAIIQEIVAKVNQLQPQISLYQSVWLRAYSAKLKGVVCSATGYTAYNDMYWEQ